MKIKYWALLLSCTMFASCNKLIEKSPDRKYVIPSTLEDYQRIFDIDGIAERSATKLGDIASDDLYLTLEQWQSSPATPRKVYLWEKETFKPLRAVQEWDLPYESIYYCNLVLDGLSSIKGEEAETIAYRNLKGSALFARSFLHFNLAQLFAKPYSADAATDPGIPYRKNSLLTDRYVRGTVAGTYNNILADALESAALLPALPQKALNRPCIPAAFALLARIYLSMGDYSNAFKYADSSLEKYSTLLDYNGVDNTQESPLILTQNPEVMYSSTSSGFNGIPGSMVIPQDLYNSYSNDDLRKKCFFSTDPSTSLPSFKGGYHTRGEMGFTGFATDEMYLTRAECFAREGKTTEAMNDLNMLLAKRFTSGTFTPLAATDADDALDIILKERRKELVFRGLRWSDLRRFNLEGGARAKTLTRVLDGITYTLLPNDLRYVFLIPENEISMAGLQQNPR